MIEDETLTNEPEKKNQHRLVFTAASSKKYDGAVERERAREMGR